MPSSAFDVERRREAAFLALAALGVFATRVRYLPGSLEDIDSVNFDLGVHDFNPFLHQPHPPGFAVFIALAKVAHPFFDNHAAGLAFVAAVCSAISLPPLYLLARDLVGRSPAILAVTLVVLNPLFWINSVRPMSDVTGFATLVCAQWLLVNAWSRPPSDPLALRVWIAGAVTAGFALGVRIQNATLLMPILALGFYKHPRFRIPTVWCLTSACAAWIVPTITESGGFSFFWARLKLMLAVAWPSEPLAAQLSWYLAYRSAVDIAVLPWANTWIACCVLVSLAAGVVMMWRARRRELGVLLVLFAPYTLYHFLFQETATLRYAIPTLPLVAIPAAFGMSRAIGKYAPLVVTPALAVILAIVAVPKVATYARNVSPPVQAIQRLTQLASREPMVVSGDHVFERYLPELAPAARVIRPLPNGEWHALNRYWVAGNRGDVFYLRDPARSVLKLSDAETQTLVDAWGWPEPLQVLLKGTRPGHIELFRLAPPRWFAESGFMLTPDAGPPDRVSKEKHLLFVRRGLESDRVLISGSTAQPILASVVVGEARQEWQVSGAFSVQATVPPHAGLTAYTPVRVEADVPLLLTDVSVVGVRENLLRLTNGFYTPELDDERQQFRWIGPTASFLVSRSGTPVRLLLRGRVPLEHFHPPVLVQLQENGQPVGRYELSGSDFSIVARLAATRSRSSLVTVSTSQSFVPDKVEGNGDKRELALRLYGFELDDDPRTSP